MLKMCIRDSYMVIAVLAIALLGSTPIEEEKPDKASGFKACFAPVSYTHLDVYKRQSLKLSRNFCFRASFFEVMSASHSIIKSSISSPASKSRRRTAERCV